MSQFQYEGPYDIIIRGKQVWAWDNTVSRIKEEPTGNEITYDGSPHPLVTDGVAEKGTMQYAIGTSDSTPPGDDKWGSDVPQGTNPGT